MLANKWLLFAISGAMALLGAAQGLAWTSIVGAQTAGDIVGALGLVATGLHLIAPPVSQANIRATGGALITHT